MTRSTVATYVLLAVLMAIGAHLRLSGITDWHYSGDDLLHIEIAEASGSMGELIERAGNADTHPPLYYLTLYALEDQLQGPVAPRVPSLVFGLMLIPLWFLLGLRLAGGRVAGLFLAVLATFGTTLVAQSQTVRQYTMLACLLSGMVLCAHAYQERRRWQALAGYVVLAVLSIASHHAACIVIFAVALAWTPAVWRAPARRRGLIVWSATHAFLAATFLVIALPYMKLAGFDHPMVAYISADKSMIHSVGALLGRAYDLPRLIVAVDARDALLAVVPMLLGVAMAVSRRRWDVLLLAGVSFGLAVLLAALGYYPLVGMRWCTYLLVPLVPLAAFGVQAAWDAGGAPHRAALVLGLAVAFGVNLNTSRLAMFDADAYRTQGYDNDFVIRNSDHLAAVRHVIEHAAVGDLVVVSDSLRQRLDFDLRRGRPEGRLENELHGRARVVECSSYELGSLDAVRACVPAQLIGGARTIWVLEWMNGAPGSPAGVPLAPGVPGRGSLAVPLDAAALAPAPARGVASL